MQVRSLQGDTVDVLCWRHLGVTSGAVEQTYAKNPGLASLGPVLPSGTLVELPEANTQSVKQTTVQLWDGQTIMSNQNIRKLRKATFIGPSDKIAVLINGVEYQADVQLLQVPLLGQTSVLPGGDLPAGNEGDTLVLVGGKWVNLSAESLVARAMKQLSFAPSVPTTTVTAVEDLRITGNVLTNATTLTGTVRVVDYTVPTISVPAGKTYTAGVSSTTNPLGTLVINQDGSYQLDPRLYSYGTMPTVRFTISNGISTATGVLQFILTHVNHAPIANGDTVVVTGAVTVPVLGNDNDPDGDPISITRINATNVTAGGPAVPIANATLALNAAGTGIIVTPVNGFNGALTFTYTITDGTLSSVGAVMVTISATSVAISNNYVTGVTTPVPFAFTEANLPAKGATLTEPTTGATFKRISDVTQDFPGQAAIYNAYSRYPNENVTGEYVLGFIGNSTSCVVIDRSSGAVVASLAYDNSGLATHTIGAYHEVRWHYTIAHPYRVYFVINQQLWMIDDIRSQSTTRTLVKDFSTLIDWGTTQNSVRRIMNDQEGNSSLDSDHWAWMATFYDTATNTTRVRAYIHYQISTDTTHFMYPSSLAGFQRLPANETTSASFRYRPNMVEMAPDASGIVIHHERAYVGSKDEYLGTIFEAPYLWPIDFNPSTFTPFRIASDATHSGWSSVAGVWHFVFQDNRRDKWCACPIAGNPRGYGNEGQIDVFQALGPAVIDFHTDGGIYPAMHFGLCTGLADGWTLVSTYSSVTLDNNPISNALFLMQVKPEAQAIKWMVSPTANWLPPPPYSKQDYNEAPASINLAGTKIFVANNWAGKSPIFNSGSLAGSYQVDMYEIPLEPNWPSRFNPIAPSITTASVVTGTATQGQTLTATAGTWAGFPAPAIVRNWQRDGVDIAGAGNQTYLLQAADVGHAIRMRETATNASGSATAYSNATAAVAGLAIPVNTAAPTISGSASEGATLTGDNGTWTNAPTGYTRQWKRNGAAINGATGTTYIVQPGDIGTTITYTVTASNGLGAGAPATSAATATVVAFQGTLIRAASAVSTDPSPGSNVMSRAASEFDTQAGDLIVVSVDWVTNSGTNTALTISDTAGNTWVAGAVIPLAGGSPYNQYQVQQFWCLASNAHAGNVVTVNNGAPATPLNVSVVSYRASGGTTWTRSGGASIGTDYVPNPVVTPSFDMAANSVAVSHYYDLYGIAGTVEANDTIVHQVANTSWTLERIRGTAASGQTVTSSCTGNGYTRAAAAVSVFVRT